MTDVDVDAVARAVAAATRVTPLVRDETLTRRLGREVLVKAECLQVTGSFKIRGAAARLAALERSERDGGVVTCSSGNHGRALSWAGARLGVPVTLFVPEWVDPTKVDGARSSGADIVVAGATFDDAEAAAIDAAFESGRAYVSAYDDPWVIAGQGTIGTELLEQLGGAPAVLLAPLSGGGLIGGIASALARGGASTRIVAVSARRAAAMLASLEAGRPIEIPEEPTLANALAGGIGLENRHSFALVRDVVDEHVTVDEDDIAAAMAHSVRVTRLVVEGGGAVAWSALTSGTWAPDGAPEGPVVVVASGGNVDPKVLADVLTRAGVSSDG